MSPSPISRRRFLQGAASLPLLAAGKRLWAERAGQDDPNRPNFLVIIFDTMTAANLSLHGYQRETTPHLSRIAERATVFHQHYATANFTTPGTASLLTSTYPWTHRAYNFWGTTLDHFNRRNIFQAFQDHGYHTFAYSHNPLANLLLSQFGAGIDDLMQPEMLSLFYLYQLNDSLFQRDRNVAFHAEKLLVSPNDQPGSLIYYALNSAWRGRSEQAIKAQLDGQYPRGLPQTNEGSMIFLLEDAINWLIQELQNRPTPYFGYFHLYPPHGPYNTHRDYLHQFRDDGWQPVEKPHFVYSNEDTMAELNRARRFYDEYLLHVDAEINRLYESLAAAGQLDNTYLILTSDHGETFERGISGHGTVTLFEPLIHIPLLILKPGQQERQDVYQTTTCLDLMPTLLDVVDAPRPDWSEGRLLPTFPGAPGDDDRPVFALEAKTNPKTTRLRQATAAMIKGQEKIIHYFGYSRLASKYTAYDLDQDPEEMVDLFTTDPERARHLQAELDAKLAAVDHPV